MSFFGFDATGPPQNSTEVYDFQDTYEGLGEQLNEADDEFNDETFGNVKEVGKDFNFAGATDGNQPQLHQLQHQLQLQLQQHQQVVGQLNPGVTYAQVATTSLNDDQFMQDLWGTTNAPSQGGQEQQNQPPKQEKKILSLEEIEAQLTALDSQLQQQQYPPQHYGIPPPQYGGYMMPPNGYMPAPYMQYPNVPNHQYAPIPMQPNMIPILHPQPVVQAEPSVASTQPEAISVNPEPVANVDLSQFPILGAKGNNQQVPTILQRNYNAQPQTQAQPQIRRQNRDNYQNQHQKQHSNQYQQHHQHNQSNQQQVLTPEQEAKFSKRQEKVARIMKYSGIMNPKDKDFVTRFQLSQIVTEDPYNEDFYAQVFKVIHPKAINNSLDQDTQHNSIAQAYLEQSGHRLGGRYKRADVALQRMQQQVQKAVTVAKERPKLTQYAREGALGKISFGNGKKPRQQLEIISKAAQREKEKQEAAKKQASDESNASTENTKVDNSSISAPSTEIKKYSKKDIMNIIENIISNLMNVESESRTKSVVDIEKLWESLKVLEQPSSSGDDEAEVNPFIQCLNYNKALKILLRLFKFLSREQILTIVTLIMSNLENLTVIKHGSYTTYESRKVPESILKLVDSYSMTFTKVLMNSVLDFKFNEIIGLLVILIEHNNVSFVSTTKVGLSILTTFLSRAELIIGEGSISATDLSEWTSCYDELFTSLESRIAAIFPPNPEDIDDGSSRENYVWQFLATLSLGGKLSHQRIIVDEVRDEIFGVMSRAKAIDNSDTANLYKKQNLLNNLNMFLVVMGLVADENEIRELQN